MARDNVTFTFRIDSARASAAIKELTQALERLNATNVKVDKNLKSTQRQITNTGTNAAASAVNFQTATQGMLNLSTAAVQTFTSISNLDRAHNRAKMSIIAVARAEDLLNNKKQRLNELTEQGVTSGNKYNNMLREIATAEADLTVKQEKRGIEQAAVNDIYMLFATNIANVTISSLQTITVLLGQEKVARLASAAATKLQTLALRHGTTVQVASNVATKQAIFAQTGYSFASVKATIATHGLSVALKGLTMSFAPLMIATAALTAVWAIHESDILGTKSALDEYLGVQNDFQSEVDASRNATEEFNNALETQEDKLFSLPSSYSGLVRELENIKDKYKDVTAVVKENTNAIIINNSTSGISKRPSPNFSSGGVTTQQTAAGQAIPQGVSASTDIPFAAYADTGSQQITDQPHGVQATLQNRFVGEVTSRIQLPVGTGMQHKMGLIDGSSAPIYGFTKTDDGSFMPQGPSANKIIEEFMNRAIMEGGKDIAQSLGVSTEEGIEIYMNDPDFQIVKERIILNVISNKFRGIEGQQFKVFTPESWVDFKRDEGFKEAQKQAKESVKNKIKMLGKEKAMRGSMRQLAQTFAGPLRFSDSLFKGTMDINALKKLGGVRYVQGKLVFQEKKARLAPSRLRDALAGKSFMFDEDDPFDQLLRQTITQQHNIFDTDELNLMFEAQDFSPSRKAAYEEYGVDIGKVGDVIPKKDALRIGMLQSMSKQYQGIGGRADALINLQFGGSATAAYQVKRNADGTSPIKRNQKFIDEMRERDRLTNLKRFGGYSSRKEFIRAGKERESQEFIQAQIFSDYFTGIGRVGRYTGMTGLRSQLNSIKQRADTVKTALSSAGLSYKTFNARTGLPRSATAWQRHNFEKQWNAVRSFNDNQYAKAKQINILQQDFGVTGFTGSALTLPSLQDEVARQDALIKSIGLDRTEAFQIVDTAGRGREEIDDRIRFKDRMNSMSTGVSVL